MSFFPLFLLGAGVMLTCYLLWRRRDPSPFPYWLTPLLHAPWRRRCFPPALAAERHGIETGMRVLEVGPGDGYLTAAAQERAGPSRLVCLDVQRPMLRKLRARLGARTPALVCASGSRVPFRSESFDLVFLVHVLGEIPDRPGALAEYARVLRRGGTLAVTEGLPDPDFIRRPRLLRMAEAAGFRPKERFGGALHYTQRFEAAATGDASSGAAGGRSGRGTVFRFLRYSTPKGASPPPFPSNARTRPSPSYQVRRFRDARAFLARAEPWLLQREAEHGLLLGIARQLLRDDHPYRDGPIYLATIEDGGQVAGCAFRTPPFQLALTQMPPAALPLLARDVAHLYTALPAVFGPEDLAVHFAELWTDLVGGSWARGTRERLHVLEKLVGPNRASPGALRPAALARDLPLASAWCEGFVRDTGAPAGAPAAAAERLIRQGSLHLWEDGAPRSMVAAQGETPHGVRVSWVYTPPAFRRRGYATTAVASLSRLLLERGRRFCFLYTDLASPTPNAIYRRIGYRPIADVIAVQFSGAARER